jgi:hypothetical protein
MYLPKCIQNIMVSEETCDSCAEKSEGAVVQKIRLDVFSEGRKPLDDLLEKVNYSFCIVPGCDPNFQ